MAIKLSSKKLISAAMEIAKLEDFGGDTFKEGLDALIYSLNNDLDMSEMTAGYFQGFITQILINRLQVAILIKEHPEIMEEEIEQPIFILGLPRSGTTILHTLLALDPLSRYLRNFESALAICPPPELMTGAVDSRIQTYHDSMEGFFSMMPQLRGINGINFMANGTAECQNLMAHEFIHIGLSAGSSLFSYGEWLSECNMAHAYQYHKILLKTLQWKQPNERWVLKAPMHLFGLDHLLKTYPDARIIFTHRNPLDAMTSGISMVYHWTEFSTMQADLPAISEWYPRIWARGLERAIDIRKRYDQKTIYDIFHKDVSSNPIKSVNNIYDHFNIRFDLAHQKRMQVWFRDNPRSKFGNHIYKAQEFALNTEREKRRFQFYQDKFAV